MNYSLSTTFILVFLAGFTAFGQSGGGRDKDNRKKSPESTATAPAASSGITVPSWLPAAAPYQPSATQLTDVTDTKLDVRFEGPIALATESYDYRIETKAGEVAERRGVATSVLKKIGGEWRILSMHNSARKPRAS